MTQTVSQRAEVTIQIPSALRRFTEEHRMVTVAGSTVREALEALVSQYPALKTHLFTQEGQLRSYVNVYLGEEDIRYLQGLDTPLTPGVRLALIPSIAGG